MALRSFDILLVWIGDDRTLFIRRERHTISWSIFLGTFCLLSWGDLVNNGPASCNVPLWYVSGTPGIICSINLLASVLFDHKSLSKSHGRLVPDLLSTSSLVAIRKSLRVGHWELTPRSSTFNQRSGFFPPLCRPCLSYLVSSSCASMSLPLIRFWYP
jgi:hypothetical protein